jgi:putative DNA primase/helicase
MSDLAPASTVPVQNAAEVSEDAIALAFADQYERTLRFDHDIGRWLEWDGVRWRADRCDRGFHYAREIGRRMGAGKRQVCKASVANGVERMARADPRLAVVSSEWDGDLWKLGTPGGVVDLRSGDLLKADPTYRITKTTAVAPARGVPQLWLRFLDEALGGDSEMIALIQEWCGYCLTGDTSEHVLMFIFGNGGNGKSVLLNTITKILGDYAVTAAMETFTSSRGERHSTDVAMLKGARLVTASETEEEHSWAEARIKQLTGADPITARFMRRDNFTFIPQSKLTIAGNHAPVLQNIDEAMRRRLRIVPFDRQPAMPDRQLEAKLVKEWPQILSWMVEGCSRWQRHGLSHPKALVDATNAYFEEQDLVGQWLAQECDVGPSRSHIVADMFASWERFAKANGENPGTNKWFTRALKARGIHTGRASNRARTRIYTGVALTKRASHAE